MPMDVMQAQGHGYKVAACAPVSAHLDSKMMYLQPKWSRTNRWNQHKHHSSLHFMGDEPWWPDKFEQKLETPLLRYQKPTVMSGKYPTAPPAPAGYQPPPQSYSYPQAQYPPSSYPYQQQQQQAAPPGGAPYGAPPPYGAAAQQAAPPPYSQYPVAYQQAAPSPQAMYPQQQPQTVYAQGAFDSGARFDGVSQPRIPPPPPGVAPNHAQMASMQGHSVIGTQQKADWFSGGKGGGFTWW